MITDMAALLAPASLDDLRSAMESRRRLFIRATDPHRFGDLMPWPTANLLFFVNRFAAREIEVMQASKFVNPFVYKDAADPTQLKLDALQTLAEQGASIVINSVHKLIPAIDAISAMVERELRSKTSVNTYLSFREQGAFLPHWDDHDVLVMHLHGRKRWRCYGMRGESPTVSQVFERGIEAEDVEWEEALCPGDILYLPRGEVHAAKVEDGRPTVHLSVRVQPPRGSDIVRWIAESREDLLRMDVLPHWDIGQIKLHEARLKETLHRLVDGIDLTRVLKEMDQAREHRPASNIGMSRAVDGRTTVRSALRRRLAVPAPGSGPVAIKIGSSTYRLSSAAAALLAILQDRDAITVAMAQDAMPPQNAQDILPAVHELARKGLVYLDTLHTAPDDEA